MVRFQLLAFHLVRLDCSAFREPKKRGGGASSVPWLWPFTTRADFATAGRIVRTSFNAAGDGNVPVGRERKRLRAIAAQTREARVKVNFVLAVQDLPPSGRRAQKDDADGGGWGNDQLASVIADPDQPSNQSRLIRRRCHGDVTEVRPPR